MFLILDLQRMDPVTGTWAEIGLLKEARYFLLSVFDIDHHFLLKEKMFFNNIERALLRNPGCP